jgi:hypothetical protein
MRRGGRNWSRTLADRLDVGKKRIAVLPVHNKFLATRRFLSPGLRNLLVIQGPSSLTRAARKPLKIDLHP